MWATILGVVSNQVFKYSALAVFVWAGGNYFSSLQNKAAQVDELEAQVKIIEIEKKQIEDYYERQNERLKADADLANKKRVQYRKDAQIENSKLKKLLNENKDSKNWHDTVYPAGISELRDQRKIHNK